MLQTTGIAAHVAVCGTLLLSQSLCVLTCSGALPHLETLSVGDVDGHPSRDQKYSRGLVAWQRINSPAEAQRLLHMGHAGPVLAIGY
jgi:hypothetical protein